MAARRVRPPPWHPRGPRAPGAAAPIGRLADGGQRPAPASAAAAHPLRGPAPAAEPAALRAPPAAGGGGAGAAPQRPPRRPADGGAGVASRVPCSRRPGCIYPTSAPSGSRELGSQPAEAAALSGSASRPPSSCSSSPPPCPRPAPSPPAEVEVTAAPAAPGSWARAPPPAGMRRAPGSAGGGRGNWTLGPASLEGPQASPSRAGWAEEEKAPSSRRGGTGDPRGVGVRPELMNGVVFAAWLSPPREAPTHPACARSR